ncbi:DUF427 domain-containing protein [Pontibaca salina]|uniref:DUF427 domain-containing protein n=1 Tax=Pontibaca salina TaxID=2795731 RepID=A0A934HNX7_9RHOB|nr:DUF427 domain-containing protein [Pontibaca salina]MBI6629057.1 DUF427 domain-containing protein [Pontibaca salina]
MADPIKIRKADGTWCIRVGGAVLGESSNVLELSEGHLPPVLYFPRDDIAMQLLDRSATITHSPSKGDAYYYSIVNKSATLEDAVWSYEAPRENVAAIKDHLAFYASDDITVERI